jgi:HD superfamily phosphohydrolase
VYGLVAADEESKFPAGYCVKVLKPERLQDVKAETAFRREARLMELLQPPEDDKPKGDEPQGGKQEGDESAQLRAAPALSLRVVRKPEEQVISEVPYHDASLPFFVMERGLTVSRLLKSIKPPAHADEWDKRFHEKFWSSRDKVGAPRLGADLVQMLRDLDHALHSLHNAKRPIIEGEEDVGYHLDVKAENIVVVFDFLDETGIAPYRYRLLDFGSLRTSAEWHARQASFETTYDTMPYRLRRTIDIREATSDKRVRVDCATATKLGFKPQEIDRHQLGRVVKDIIQADSPYADVRKQVSADDRETLLELAECLMHSDDPDDPGRVDDSSRVEDVLDRIENAPLNVSRTFGPGFVQLPGTSLRTFDEAIRHVVSTRIFKRLSGMLQLGLTHKVYPGATHTRYEHGLGTFQVAVDYLKALLSKTGSRWLAARVDHQQARLCALHALLHDIGQYPYAHYLEDVGLFPSHEKLTRAILTYDEDVLSLNCRGVSPSPCGSTHATPEECPARLVKKEDLDEFHEALEDAFDIVPDDWCDWFDEIDQSREKPRKAKQGLMLALSQIVDGPIDADKFDYVRRDAAHCGFLAIGGIERDLFLSSLSVCSGHSGGAEVERYVLGVRENALCALEQLSLARYHLYTLDYWNSQCRSYTVMLRDAVTRSLDTLIAKKKYGELWDRIALWCRNPSEEAALSMLSEWGEDCAGVDSLVDDIREGRSPHIVAEVGDSSPAPFHAMRSVAAKAKKLPEGPKWVPSYKEPQFLAAGTRLVESIAPLVADEIPDVPKERLLVDVPMQKITKPDEAARCGVLQRNGEVVSPGPVWDAIVPAMNHWPRRIRVMVRTPSVDCVAARKIQRSIEDLYR